MPISLQEVVLFLVAYKYWLIFPITVIEGPIITVISGFLASTGVLNGYWAYGVLVVADLVGDILHYSLGRYGRDSAVFKKWGKYLGYAEKHEATLERHFQKHTGKTLVLGKIAHGLGGAVLIAAGVAKVNFWEFFWYNLLATVPKTLILFLIGYYLGSYYVQIDKYLGYVSAATLGLAITLLLVYVFSNRAAEKSLEK